MAQILNSEFPQDSPAPHNSVGKILMWSLPLFLPLQMFVCSVITFTAAFNVHASDCDFCLHVIVLLQLLLERKSKEVEKLIKETDKKITDLAENINEAKVNSG